MRTSRAFTLIEVMVVIAIITILAGITIMSLSTVRARSRDVKRISDLSELQDALQVYYSAYHTYPDSGGTWRGNCSSWGGYGTTGANGWIPNLAPTFIPSLPLDPKPIAPANCYLYQSFNNNQDYEILAFGTVESYTTANNPKPRPGAPNELDFAVYTAGGAH